MTACTYLSWGDNFIVGNLSSMGEAVDCVVDANKDFVVFPVQVGAEFINRGLGHLGAVEGHVFVVGEWRAEIEVFDIENSEGGIFGSRSIEEKFDSLKVSRVG